LNKIDAGSELVSDDQKLVYERYLNQTQASLSTQGQQNFLKNKAEIER
jgi:peptidyl-prolyl cis-trans isomerase D